MIISTVSDSGKAATRERILEAAAQVFAESGYHGASVDDIAHASGGSKGGIYFHFPGKREIFFALVNRFADRLLADAGSSISGDAGGAHKAGAAIESTLKTFSNHSKLAKVLLASGVGLGPAFDESLMRLHDRFAALIRERLDAAVADGSIPSLDTTLASYAWMGALNEVILRWLYTGQPSPLTCPPRLNSNGCCYRASARERQSSRQRRKEMIAHEPGISRPERFCAFP